MKLPAGKLPPTLLRQLLRHRGAPDRSIVVGPAFGEDAAVVHLRAHYLVLKSDPVTFTTSELGWYAVHVNANDIATTGATPRTSSDAATPRPSATGTPNRSKNCPETP